MVSPQKFLPHGFPCLVKVQKIYFIRRNRKHYQWYQLR